MRIGAALECRDLIHYIPIDVSVEHAQTVLMTPRVTELKKLGLDAARHVAGRAAVKQVDVVHGEDSTGRPVYYFTFLIDQARARERAGLVRIRLIQKLREELIARSDGHLPVIQILSQDDWDERAVA